MIDFNVRLVNTGGGLAWAVSTADREPTITESDIPYIEHRSARLGGFTGLYSSGYRHAISQSAGYRAKIDHIVKSPCTAAELPPRQRKAHNRKSFRPCIDLA